MKLDRITPYGQATQVAVINVQALGVADLPWLLLWLKRECMHGLRDLWEQTSNIDEVSIAVATINHQERVALFTAGKLSFGQLRSEGYAVKPDEYCLQQVLWHPAVERKVATMAAMLWQYAQFLLADGRCSRVLWEVRVADERTARVAIAAGFTRLRTMAGGKYELYQYRSPGAPRIRHRAGALPIGI